MRRSALIVLLSLLLAAPAAVASQDEAREWLQRMTDSLAGRNYDGLFTHTTSRRSETMRIVHRVENGKSVERLVSLDGSAREIVRTASEVHCYLPDRRVVLVETDRASRSLLGALPAPGPTLDAFYSLAISDGHKLLGRDVRVVDVRPRDTWRYGYRLWLDAETAMPLRTVVADGRGRPVEMTSFTRLDLPRRIDARETQPAVDATGFKWIRTGSPATARSPAMALQPRRVPPGFRLVAARLQAVPGQVRPVQHMIFSDGFATVSLFIEPAIAQEKVPVEASSLGSSNAFTTSAHGHVVTAVGEVPAATVKDLASSVEPVASTSGLAER